MPELTYFQIRLVKDKPLVWLAGAVKTPPFSTSGRLEAGYLLRRLQRGDRLRMPHSRSMSAIGPACHELRVRDEDHSWRLIYRVDHDAIVVVSIFEKRTRQTPREIVAVCRKRLAAYDEANREGSRE